MLVQAVKRKRAETPKNLQNGPKEKRPGGRHMKYMAVQTSILAQINTNSDWPRFDDVIDERRTRGCAHGASGPGKRGALSQRDGLILGGKPSVEIQASLLAQGPGYKCAGRR